MKYTTLGKTDLKVSQIGFGAWGIGGGAKDIRWTDMWKAKDEDSKKSLSIAYEKGVNFFDTAYVYGDGHSERLIGEVLKNKNIIIATKVPPLDRHWPARNKDINAVFPKDHIIKMAKKSYENLGNRTIDILQLHVWLDDWIDHDDWREAFSILKEQGIAKYFGVSINDHDPDSALKIVDSGEIDTIQVIYNIFDQSPKKNLFPKAKQKNIGIIARVPLDEGSLSGKFTSETTFNDWRKDYFIKERLLETVNKVNNIQKNLINTNRTMSQIALKFTISDGADIAIVGMRNPNHVDENTKSVDITLNTFDMDYLKSQKWLRNFYPEDI